MSDPLQDAWIGRVLGYDIPVPSGAENVAIAEAAAAWRDAREAVDQQVSKLQQFLRSSEDEELRDIGEYGLNALTNNLSVPLEAALVGARAGKAGDLKKLAQAAQALKSHLEADERVEAFDDNPFGIDLDIRGTLIPALEPLSRPL